MFPDLLSATRDYWRKLDAVEAAYKRGELSIEEVDAKVQALMTELGAARQRSLRAFWASLQYFVRQQRETLAGVAAIAVLAYVWLTVNLGA